MSNPQLWVSAVEIGCFFGLLALAYFVVMTGAGFFNFAIGPYAMVGGLCVSWLVIQHNWSLWPAVVTAIVVVGCLAAVTELVVVRPVMARGATGDLPALVAVAAVLFAVQQLAGYYFGYVSLPGQPLSHHGAFSLGSARVDPTATVLVVVTAVAFTGVMGWMRLTRTGRLLRAVGDSRAAAVILGLPVGRIRLVAFTVSGVLAGIAGILFAPKAGVRSLSGLTWTVDGFLAFVIGGTGSIWAPLLGGLLLGIMEEFLPYYVGGASQDYGLLVAALVFFAFRPQGLFTRAVRI